MGRLKDGLQFPNGLAELHRRVDCRVELRQIEGIEAPWRTVLRVGRC
jgi:hypothetical protein